MKKAIDFKYEPQEGVWHANIGRFQLRAQLTDREELDEDEQAWCWAISISMDTSKPDRYACVLVDSGLAGSASVAIANLISAMTAIAIPLAPLVRP